MKSTDALQYIVQQSVCAWVNKLVLLHFQYNMNTAADSIMHSKLLSSLHAFFALAATNARRVPFRPRLIGHVHDAGA